MDRMGHREASDYAAIVNAKIANTPNMTGEWFAELKALFLAGDVRCKFLAAGVSHHGGRYGLPITCSSYPPMEMLPAIGELLVWEPKHPEPPVAQ